MTYWEGVDSISDGSGEANCRSVGMYYIQPIATRQSKDPSVTTHLQNVVASKFSNVSFYGTYFFQ